MADGSYDDFSIVVENLTGDFYSVNFCVDMELFPMHLAYNLRSMIFNPFRAKKIFQTQSKELFELDNRELMIALIKESFTTLYGIEKTIDLNLQPKIYNDIEINKYYDVLVEFVADLDESQNKLWEFDWMEYSNRGFNVFVVNYKDETKVVFVQQKLYYDRDEYERYFYKDKSPKQTSFFDENYWSVKVATLPTAKLLSINSQIVDEFPY